MGKLTPEQFADKQARNLKNSTESIRIGIENVTESPMAKAVKQKDKMRQNFNLAMDNGKWERNTLAVDLPTWKAAVLDKGMGRIAAGIDGARDKVVKFAEQLIPFEDNLQKEIDKMPNTTLDDSINRMTAWARGMAKFQRR